MAAPWYSYRVSQSYGQNGEKGVDLATPFHTPITALFAGTVRFAGRTQWSCGSSGDEVTIVCNLPGLGLMTSYYLHLDEHFVNVGDTVPAGHIIGLSGGQLSGGNSPVVNCPPRDIYSTGPHTEFGFNAPWVSGPGHNIDPTPYILAARAGTLPSTSPDGTVTQNLNLSTGATPTYSQVQADAITASLINAYAAAAQTKKVITNPMGFDGICKDIDYNMEFPEWNWMNPFGSAAADLVPFALRAVFFFVGLMLCWWALKEIIKPLSDKVMGVASAIPQVGAASTAASTLEEAPEVAAL